MDYGNAVSIPYEAVDLAGTQNNILLMPAMNRMLAAYI